MFLVGEGRFERMNAREKWQEENSCCGTMVGLLRDIFRSFVVVGLSEKFERKLCYHVRFGTGVVRFYVLPVISTAIPESKVL